MLSVFSPLLLKSGFGGGGWVETKAAGAKSVCPMQCWSGSLGGGVLLYFVGYKKKNETHRDPRGIVLIFYGLDGSDGICNIIFVLLI